MSGVIEKFQFLQSEGDVLSTTRLAKASLIEEDENIFFGGRFMYGYMVLLGYLAFTGSVGCPYHLHKLFF